MSYNEYLQFETFEMKYIINGINRVDISKKNVNFPRKG
jgi:hypothetical protein